MCFVQFSEFFKNFKEETSEIKKIEKVQCNESDSENQPPKKRRRTITNDSDSFKGNGIRLQFRRRYNTRNRKQLSNNDESNDSDNEEENDSDEENESLKDNQPRLKVLFPWAKPFQRFIDLMKVVCDVDEENTNSEEYNDDIFNGNTQKKKRSHRSNQRYDPDNIPSVDDITEKMLKNVAKKFSDKTYCKIRGTSCHQCRQKTLDTKTVCRSGECIGVRGQFCGPCLQGRYGENAAEALKDPVNMVLCNILVYCVHVLLYINIIRYFLILFLYKLWLIKLLNIILLNIIFQDWACPPCRSLCNCSICRNRNGLNPTGCLAPKIQCVGYSSVMDYLQAEELQDAQ